MYQIGIIENEAFEKNLAEVRAAHATSFEKPLIVLSRGYWHAMPFLSEAENQQAWEAWQEIQSELAALSSDSKQVIAQQSGHFIQLRCGHFSHACNLVSNDALRTGPSSGSPFRLKVSAWLYPSSYLQLSSNDYVAQRARQENPRLAMRWCICSVKIITVTRL